MKSVLLPDLPYGERFDFAHIREALNQTPWIVPDEDAAESEARVHEGDYGEDDEEGEIEVRRFLLGEATDITPSKCLPTPDDERDGLWENALDDAAQSIGCTITWDDDLFWVSEKRKKGTK